MNKIDIKRKIQRKLLAKSDNDYEFLMAHIDTMRSSGSRWLFGKWCELYFQTPEWKKLRIAVKLRANNVCECCYENPIVYIHHLTYKRLGKEKLEDLEGLCKFCHNITHKRRGKTGEKLERKEQNSILY